MTAYSIPEKFSARPGITLSEKIIRLRVRFDFEAGRGATCSRCRIWWPDSMLAGRNGKHAHVCERCNATLEEAV